MTRTTNPKVAMEHALLGLLLRKPMHGYDIYRELRDARGLWQIWRIKQSRLYALLAKLEDEGLISATVQTQETRPPRKVFHLTRRGRSQFRTWLRAPVPHGRELRQDFLAKLYFAMLDDPASSTALIAAQRAACRAWLHAMPAAERDVAGEQPFERVVNGFRRSQIEATLKWLDDCERAVVPPRGAVGRIHVRANQPR
jgi:DNA-binding PadR family transcriptional regulator